MPQIELYRPFVNKRERIPCLDLTLLYLAQHQSFTGESRSWSRGIELGPRPRMEFHFTSKLHNQAYSEPKCLSLWLTWHHLVISHPSPPSPRCSLSELSVISPSEMRLRAAVPASGSGSESQTGWKAGACCSHLGAGLALASVRPLIRCLLSPTRTLRCVHSPQEIP